MYKFTPLYYSTPVQVDYIENGCHKCGILYKDDLIDCETGEVLNANEVVYFGIGKGIDPDNVIVELPWTPLEF